MRTGNGRTSVKPGRREAPRSVGYAVRPTRLPPTLPPPVPGGRCRFGTNSAISWPDRSLPPRRAKRPRRGRGPSRCGAAAMLGLAHNDQPQTSLRRRTRISPATSRLLLGAACREGRVRPGPSPSSCRPSTRSWRGGATAADGPAGPASLIEQNQPTGVTTRCGLCCSAGLRRRLDERRVLVRLVQLERAGFRSDRANLPSKRSPAGVAAGVLSLRRCLFVVG